MTIISPTGWLVAMEAPKLTTPVIAWHKDGTPIVAIGKVGAAVPVTDLTEYYRLERADGPIVGVLPAGGWSIQFAGGDDGPIPPEPLIGWAVTAQGDALPILRVDGDHGEVHDVRGDGSAELIPPTGTPEAAGK